MLCPSRKKGRPGHRAFAFSVRVCTSRTMASQPPRMQPLGRLSEMLSPWPMWSSATAA